MNFFRMNQSGLVVIFSVLVLWGCLNGAERTLPPSTGKTGDLLIVMDSAYWTGATGRAAEDCFSAIQEGLPQGEPLFNVIRLSQENFKQIFKTTRNIVVISKNKIKAETKYLLKQDVWAKNQLVLMLLTENDETAARIIQKNCETMQDAFNMEEVRRLQQAYKLLQNRELTEDIMSNFGVRPEIPSDYKVASSTEELVWLRKDFENSGHQISMGIIFYAIPYQAESDLETEHLMNVRDEITKVVEGPSKGSHMTHYREYVPVTKELNIHNKYVKRLRGLWSMKGAFMGGPFVQVVFVDDAGKRLICVDGYVFSPGFDKREYLRELEVIALSAVP